jgi:DNA-binding transcriptional ArsR family regulator
VAYQYLECTSLNVLADPTRRVVLYLLRQKPLPVGELAARLPISRPAVSQHLRVLKAARLVREERQGTRHFFSLDPGGFSEIRAYIDSMWGDALDSFASFVGEQKKLSKRGSPSESKLEQRKKQRSKLRKE